MANSDIKLHISAEERLKWNKVCSDYEAHQGSTGGSTHGLADGVSPGFSTNDFTNAEKEKLAGIADHALNNPHPEKHPYTMIEGLAPIAHTGAYTDLQDVPATFVAKGGDSDTVNGNRVTTSDEAPSNPTNGKDLWFDTNEMLIKVYKDNQWVAFGAVFG